MRIRTRTDIRLATAITEKTLVASFLGCGIADPTTTLLNAIFASLTNVPYRTSAATIEWSSEGVNAVGSCCVTAAKGDLGVSGFCRTISKLAMCLNTEQILSEHLLLNSPAHCHHGRKPIR